MRDGDVEHELARAGVERSFARGFLRNAKFIAAGRSIYQLYKEVTESFPESARRECLAMARVIDALLRSYVAAALEHACRRLGGVHTAAETGNWAMCERLESEAQQRSFVPEKFMRSALKSVTQMQAVKKSAADADSTANGRAKKATGGKGGYRRGQGGPASNPGRNAKDPATGAGSSRKKKGGSDSQ
jgi:hypothetical protein